MRDTFAMFLYDCLHSQPQQLSTYALTLFKYKTTVNDKDVHVG